MPLCKFIYSVTKNDKVSNWSQEIHAITPILILTYPGKGNALADSLSGLRCLGLYEDNYPEKPGYEYGKSIFDTICGVDSNQTINNEFEIKDIEYYLDEKDQANLQFQCTDTHTVDTNSLSHMCNLNLAKIE